MKHLLSIVAVAVITHSAADAFGGCGDCKPEGCCNAVRCQPCMLVCRCEVKTEPVKKRCYCVKCDHVCIPGITLPCETSPCDCVNGSCGKSDCATCCPDSASCCSGGKKSLLRKLCGKLLDCRVRAIKVAEEKEYVCGTKCVCEWHLERIPLCCCSTGCGKSACGACVPCGCTPAK